MKVLSGLKFSLSLFLILAISACSSHSKSVQDKKVNLVGEWTVKKIELVNPDSYDEQMKDKLHAAMKIMKESIKWKFNNDNTYHVEMVGQDTEEHGSYTNTDSTFTIISSTNEKRTASIVDYNKSELSYRIKISKYYMLFTIVRV